MVTCYMVHCMNFKSSNILKYFNNKGKDLELSYMAQKLCQMALLEWDNVGPTAAPPVRHMRLPTVVIPLVGQRLPTGGTSEGPMYRSFVGHCRKLKSVCPRTKYLWPTVGIFCWLQNIPIFETSQRACRPNPNNC